MDYYGLLSIAWSQSVNIIDYKGKFFDYENQL